jgi:hypothetical protein
MIRVPRPHLAAVRGGIRARRVFPWNVDLLARHSPLALLGVGVSEKPLRHNGCQPTRELAQVFRPFELHDRPCAQAVKLGLPSSSPKPSATAIRLIQLIVRDLARKEVAVAAARRSK